MQSAGSWLLMALSLIVPLIWIFWEFMIAKQFMCLSQLTIVTWFSLQFSYLCLWCVCAVHEHEHKINIFTNSMWLYRSPDVNSIVAGLIKRNNKTSQADFIPIIYYYLLLAARMHSQSFIGSLTDSLVRPLAQWPAKPSFKVLFATIYRFFKSFD